MNTVELEDIATDFLIVFLDTHRRKFMNEKEELPSIFDLNRNGIKALVSQALDTIDEEKV